MSVNTANEVECANYSAYCVAACAPPVGLYDPKDGSKAQAAIINSGDDRFKEPKCEFSYFRTMFVVMIVIVACSEAYYQTTVFRLPVPGMIYI